MELTFEEYVDRFAQEAGYKDSCDMANNEMEYALIFKALKFNYEVGDDITKI
jgi:hypothetical protein